MFKPTNPPDVMGHVPYEDGIEPDPIKFPEDNDPVDTDGKSVFEKPITNQWINAELNLPQGNTLQSAKVIGQAKNSDGEVVGIYDEIPFLNTLVHDVQFSDGEIKEYVANIIAENIYSQVDSEGYQYQLMEKIIDHRRNGNVVEKDDLYITTKSGKRRMHHTTAGLDLLVQWKNRSQEWIPLSVVRNSNPIETAEYAKSQGINDEPAFIWWVPYTLQQRDQIIVGVNSRVKKTTHKYGVELPRTIDEVLRIDKKNCNSFWQKAIKKEMENLKVTFDILLEGARPPPGYRLSSGHLVFDVWMTLKQKARWVKDGHKTPEPEWSTYAGVVLRESVRIALTYAMLNDLPICAAAIQNPTCRLLHQRSTILFADLNLDLRMFEGSLSLFGHCMVANQQALITGDM